MSDYKLDADIIRMAVREARYYVDNVPTDRDRIIVALSDENDRLRAERDEAVALLEDSSFVAQCVPALHDDDGDECQDVEDGRSEPCPEHRRRALLAKLRTP